MARAGRPRKQGDRKPSGDLRRRFEVDHGSPGLLMHRTLAISPHLAGLDPDELARNGAARDRRAAYPLGILYARRVITGPMHYAGGRYAGLFCRTVRGISLPSIMADLVGRGAVRAVNSETPRDGVDTAKAAADARAAYLACRRILEAAACAPSVDHVAVYQLWPADSQLARLLRGLDLLRRHFEAIDSAKREILGPARSSLGGTPTGPGGRLPAY